MDFFKYLLVSLLVFSTCSFAEGTNSQPTQRHYVSTRCEAALKHLKYYTDSLELQREIEFLERAAPSTASVLISGETGTGKERLAEAVHLLSGRPGKFIAVNVSAISNGLEEAEFFGHTKGSFTGSNQEREGLILAANRGTLFLDEIGEMSSNLQTKLLRVLQTQRVRKVGSDEELYVDFRVVAATNRNLDELVKSGKFREDLLYRLKVISINLPPLRQRQEDIRLLSKKFVEELAEKNGRGLVYLSDEALEKLLSYNWPGNIRQLRNVIERAVILSYGSEIQSFDIQLPISQSVQMDPKNKPTFRPFSFSDEVKDEMPNVEPTHNDRLSDFPTFKDFVKLYISRVLQDKIGINDYSKACGIDRRTLLRRIKQLGIERSSGYQAKIGTSRIHPEVDLFLNKLLNARFLINNKPRFFSPDEIIILYSAFLGRHLNEYQTLDLAKDWNRFTTSKKNRAPETSSIEIAPYDNSTELQNGYEF